mmetsp:Transcript_37214/g.72601  ORF Transcript_37214/g.72601 Transcript_37214/m.72601 type:complete len:215 (-) Transcript_37214:684-1328(-)
MPLKPLDASSIVDSLGGLLLPTASLTLTRMSRGVLSTMFEVPSLAATSAMIVIWYTLFSLTENFTIPSFLPTLNSRADVKGGTKTSPPDSPVTTLAGHLLGSTMKLLGIVGVGLERGACSTHLYLPISYTVPCLNVTVLPSGWYPCSLNCEKQSLTEEQVGEVHTSLSPLIPRYLRSTRSGIVQRKDFIGSSLAARLTLTPVRRWNVLSKLFVV